VSDKFKVNGSVARKVLRDLHSKNLIKQVGDHHSAFTLYAGTVTKAPEPVKGEKAPAGEKKPAPQKKGKEEEPKKDE
jgi:S25 ribosomal protein